MKNLLFVLAMILFASCHSNHRNNRQEKISNESTTPQMEEVDSVVTTIPTKVIEPTLEEKFYSEIFNKENLKIKEWQDSIIEASEGEGSNTYKLPVKVQHGSTERFVFILTTAYEYYEENGYENKPFVISFKPRGEAEEGKTLAEDKVNREFYGWKTLYPPLSDSLKMFWPTIVYPKKFIHKKE